LPATWRAEILSTAIREAHAAEQRARFGPPSSSTAKSLRRNPFTATALTALWLLIFLFKATTPVDPRKKCSRHFDPTARLPRLAPGRNPPRELLQDQPEQSQPRQIREELSHARMSKNLPLLLVLGLLNSSSS